MTARTRWVGFIIGLLVANIVATSVLIAMAHHGASQVLPSYNGPVSK
jgi:hypothetical protein